MQSLTVHAYDWKIKDQYDSNGKLVVHAWCLDRNSTPHLLRFHDFPAFCQVELPLYIGHKIAHWSNYKARQVFDYLTYIMGESAPERFFFERKRKLYFFRNGRKYPIMTLLFKTVRAMHNCKERLNSAMKIRDLGFVKCNVWETQIPLERKLLTLAKCKYSQWFTIDAKLVSPDEKISTLDCEYIVDRRTLTPIPLSETESWITHPKMLAFDIETYSNRHNAFPNEYVAKCAIFNVSCVYQEAGRPETRQKYIIVFGDSDPIDDINMIKVNTEIELIDAMADLIVKFDPDILTGYNIFSFDYPYLDVRLKRRLREWKPCSRLLNEIPHLKSSNWGSSGYGHNSINILNMDGRISIDMYPIIRRDYKLSLYRLDFVSKHFLGRGKHDVNVKEMFLAFENQQNAHKQLVSVLSKLDRQRWSKKSLGFSTINLQEILDWTELHFDANSPSKLDVTDAIIKYQHAKDDMTRVMAYCVEDSTLCLDLFDTINCWIGLIELSNVVGVTIVELFTRGQQIRTLSQVYDLAYHKKIVIDERHIPKMNYSGGFVYEPIPGIYTNIPCLDFKSLYPTVMIAYNICYTTFVPPHMMDKIPDDMCHVIEWDEEADEDTDDDDDLDDSSEKVKSSKKVHYRYKFVKEPKGLIPQLLENLISERDIVKAKMKAEKNPVTLVVLDRRQLALKISANSVSGNTPIPCLYKNRVLYLTIEELANPKTWRVDNGQNQVAQPHPKLKVWSDIGWTDIRHVIRHPVKKPLIRVLTHTGSVDCTDEHSLLTPEGQEVNPNDLSVGSPLMHVDTPLPPDTPTEPQYITFSNKTIMSHQLETVHERMAFAWGLFFAEGTCRSYRANQTAKSSWCIYNKNRKLLNKARDIFNEIEPDCRFKVYDYVKYNTILPNGSDHTHPIFYLKPSGKVKALIQKYCSMFYDRRKNKRVPQQILSTSYPIRLAFMLGYYSADCNYHLKTGIVIVNKGQIGTAGLYYLARSLGYQVSIYSSEKARKADLFGLQCCTRFRNASPNQIKQMLSAPTPPRIEKQCVEEDHVEYIYDIETASHHFAAGVGNMIVHNSTYGGFGAQKGGKLPLPEGAACITAKSRESIIKVNDYLISKGKKIVYGDSVTGDTPILCREQLINGSYRIFYIPISQLYAGTWLHNTETNKEYCLNVSNLQVWSDQGFTEIKHVMRHKTKKRIYRITAHTGVIKVTEDHSLLNEQAEEVQPSQVKLKDRLLTSSLPVLADVGIDITEAWVWGLFYGDGSCGTYNCDSGAKTSWEINNQNLDYLNKAKIILERVYPNNRFKILDTMKSSNVYKLVAAGDIVSLMRQWCSLFYDPVTRYKKVPDILWQSSKSSREAFYQGCYAADGDKDDNGYKYFDNKGQIGSAGIFFLARSLGYKVSCNTRKDKPLIYRMTLTKNSQHKHKGEITRIEDYGYIDDYVYDLETNNHHFSAGVGELVVHNTDSSMPDLDLKNCKTAHQECEDWAKQLSALFPPPMAVEVDWVAALMFNICKKKYAYFLLDRDGTPNISIDAIKVKGIILARRDNCEWQRRTFRQVLFNIMTGVPMMDTLDYIYNECFKLITGQVPWEDLVMIKGLGSNYKSANYFMKVFGDELIKIGKPAKPGDRLEFLIVTSYGTEGQKELLGKKMRLPSTYLERLASNTPERIDATYYIEKILKNCVEQIFQVGYQDEIRELEAKFTNSDQSAVLNGVIAKDDRYSITILQLMATYNQDKLQVINYLRKSNNQTKKLIGPLFTKYITRRNKPTARITKTPINNFVKMFTHKQKVMNEIKAINLSTVFTDLKQARAEAKLTPAQKRKLKLAAIQKQNHARSHNWISLTIPRINKLKNIN